MRRSMVLGIFMVVWLSINATHAVAQDFSQLPLNVAFEPTVKQAIVFTGDSLPHASYELSVSNYNLQSMRITALQLTGTKGKKGVFSRRYTGDALSAIFSSVAGRYGAPQDPVLPPGGSARIYLFLDFDSADSVPTLITQSIEVRKAEDDNARLETVVSRQAVRLIPSREATISPPLRGQNWWTPNGPGNFSVHRRVTIALDGRVIHPEHFAVDWVQLGPNGATFAGDTTKNENYYAYGKEVLSVGGGKVISLLDDIPENVPNQPPVYPLTVENLGGNHVVVDMGDGRYAFYAHLIPESLRVSLGDQVQRGDVLGLLGNSGNSTEPHLHFHVMDSPHPLNANGLPFHLDAFIRRSYIISCGAPGQNCDPSEGPTNLVIGPGTPVFGEIFMSNGLGDFPARLPIPPRR